MTNEIGAISRSEDVVATADLELNKIVANYRVLAFKFDREGRCLFAHENACKMLGRPNTELLGKVVSEILPESNDAYLSYEAALREVFDRGTPADCRFSIKNEEEQMEYLIVFTPTPQIDGVVSNAYGLAFEITKILRDIHASDRRKDQFLAIVAHEMRNPISSLAAGLRLLEHASSDQPLADVRQLMGTQISNLSRLVDDILDVSHIRNGRLRLALEVIDAHEIVKIALETCKPALERGNHELQVDLPQEPLTIFADRQRLSQVLMNLLDNAAKYTPPGGKITLKVSEESGEVFFAVSDNGIGVAPEYSHKIFELFSQLDAGLDKRKGGVGIGLYLVKMIVEAHRGKIHMVSDGPGKGSAFVVRIPKK
jgi:signal transduction histidine kinase